MILCSAAAAAASASATLSLSELPLQWAVLWKILSRGDVQGHSLFPPFLCCIPMSLFHFLASFLFDFSLSYTVSLESLLFFLYFLHHWRDSQGCLFSFSQTLIRFLGTCWRSVFFRPDVYYRDRKYRHRTMELSWSYYQMHLTPADTLKHFTCGSTMVYIEKSETIPPLVNLGVTSLLLLEHC